MTTPPMYLDDVIRAVCDHKADVYTKLYIIRVAAQVHRSRGKDGASYGGEISGSVPTVGRWLSCSLSTAKRTIEKAGLLGLVRVRRRKNPLPPKVSLCLEGAITVAVLL